MCHALSFMFALPFLAFRQTAARVGAGQKKAVKKEEEEGWREGGCETCCCGTAGAHFHAACWQLFMNTF